MKDERSASIRDDEVMSFPLSTSDSFSPHPNSSIIDYLKCYIIVRKRADQAKTRVYHPVAHCFDLPLLF